VQRLGGLWAKSPPSLFCLGFVGQPAKGGLGEIPSRPAQVLSDAIPHTAKIPLSLHIFCRYHRRYKSCRISKLSENDEKCSLFIKALIVDIFYIRYNPKMLVDAGPGGSRVD
jgi:hypothetical protein